MVSPAASSVPAYANVMACVVEFDDFFSAYGKVGVDDRVSGFRHSAVNYYGNRYHTYDVSLPLWQQSIQTNIQKHLRCQNVMRRRGPDDRNRSGLRGRIDLGGHCPCCRILG